MLEGDNGFAGGNITVSAGEDGIMIVDDPFSEMSEKIKSSVSKITPETSAKKINFFLNTHWQQCYLQSII